MSKKETCQGGGCPTMKTSIGGQALMEGIMMRGPQKTAMAVRNTKGEIVVEMVPMSQKKKPAVFKWPIIRGVVSFASSMALGYRCLMRSAELSGLEEIEEELKQEKAAKKAAKAAKKASKKSEPVEEMSSVQADQTDSVTDSAESVSTETPAADVAADTKDKKKGMSPMMWVISVLSAVLVVIVVVGLFIFLPTFLFEKLAGVVSWLDADNRYQKSIFEGLLKVVLLVGYMALISLMKDIRRTFMYHGAEHKTIFCYEKGLELTVENVRKQKRFHPRCGTSFLILMVLVSILVGFLIPPALPKTIRSIIRLLLVPVIAGVGFELIKFCGRHDNWLTRIIAAPGVALQHITVFEPDDGMIECAIAAVREVIPEDGSDRL